MRAFCSLSVMSARDVCVEATHYLTHRGAKVSEETKSADRVTLR